MGIEDEIDQIIKDETPTGQAVESLIKVKKREKGQDSEIELKTDLDESDVCVHTSIDMLNNFLEMGHKDFSKVSVIGELVNKKERKLLSKNRRSRLEIVEVARHPDLNMVQEQVKDSFVKRLFQRKKE